MDTKGLVPLRQAAVRPAASGGCARAAVWGAGAGGLCLARTNSRLS